MQGREQLGQRRQHGTRTVPIGHICGMDDHSQDQAPGVDQQVPLTPAQLCGTIVAAAPPFSVVLVDWLSRIAAIGAGARPARWRTCARSTALACPHVPSIRQRRKE